MPPFFSDSIMKQADEAVSLLRSPSPFPYTVLYTTNHRLKMELKKAGIDINELAKDPIHDSIVHKIHTYTQDIEREKEVAVVLHNDGLGPSIAVFVAPGHSVYAFIPMDFEFTNEGFGLKGSGLGKSALLIPSRDLRNQGVFVEACADPALIKKPVKIDVSKRTELVRRDLGDLGINFRPSNLLLVNTTAVPMEVKYGAETAINLNPMTGKIALHIPPSLAGKAVFAEMKGNRINPRKLLLGQDNFIEVVAWDNTEKLINFFVAGRPIHAEFETPTEFKQDTDLRLRIAGLEALEAAPPLPKPKGQKR